MSPVTRQPISEKIARWIAHIGSPPVMAAASAFICATWLGTAAAWRWASLHVVLTVLVPSGYVLWLLLRGYVSDIHMRARRERFWPMAVMLIGITVSVVWLRLGGAPRLLQVLAVVTLVQTAIFSLITARWKISLHSTSAANFAVLGWTLGGAAGWFLPLVLPVIMWSRLRLRYHTLSQTVAGALLGGSLLGAALLALY